MADKSSMNKMLSFKLSQINQFNNKLKEAVDLYVTKITGSAREWIDKSEDCDQLSYLQISIQVDQAMQWLTEKVPEIESNLGSQPLGIGSAGTVLKSSEQTSPQTNVSSQAKDPTLRLLQERMDALENVADMVWKLKAGLAECRGQIGSVEGMKANLENVASQVEVIMNDKSLQQIQRDIHDYKSKEVIRIQDFEDKLLKIDQTLSITDCQVKEMNNFVISLREEHQTLLDSSPRLSERLYDLEKRSEDTNERVMLMEEKCVKMEAENKQMKVQVDGDIEETEKGNNDVSVIQEKLSKLEMDVLHFEEMKLYSLDDRLQQMEEDMKIAMLKIGSVESDGTLQPAIIHRNNIVHNTHTGFTSTGTYDYNYNFCEGTIVLHVNPITNNGFTFDNATCKFTATIDGIYEVTVAFAMSNGSNSSCLRVIHENGTPGTWEKNCVCSVWTGYTKLYGISKSNIKIAAGDKLFVQTKFNIVGYIPVFSCILLA